LGLGRSTTPTASCQAWLRGDGEAITHLDVARHDGGAARPRAATTACLGRLDRSGRRG
jgi:hypothetical protein